MNLYHGSSVGGIDVLLPFSSNHDKKYVYLTHLEELAVIYAHNPLTRPNGFFSYWLKEGSLHYDEYFPDQLRILYSGQAGYVYTCRESLPSLEKMDWVYISEQPVNVQNVRFIPDLYQEILRLEDQRRIQIHRYQEHSPKRLASICSMIRREITGCDPEKETDREYLRFLNTHFPELAD